MAKENTWLSIKRVFKQHASLVVTIPWFIRRSLEVQKGDYVVFEWDPKKKTVTFYKWHKGVRRSHPDYGFTDLRHSGGRERATDGGRR